MKISFEEQYTNAMELDKMVKKVRHLGGKVFSAGGENNIRIECDSSKKKKIKEAIQEIKNEDKETH